jgi:hypothetical protein
MPCKRVQTNCTILCVRSEKCGGEELKNSFDMIHEHGYKATLQGFSSPRPSIVWSFCMRITLERLTKPPACLLIDLERHQPYGPIEQQIALKSHLREWCHGLHSHIRDKQPESAKSRPCGRRVLPGKSFAPTTQLTICKKTFTPQWMPLRGVSELLKMGWFPINRPQ